MSWQRVRGHDALVRAFQRVIRRGRLAHAYLFTGPQGVGKKLFATELAKQVRANEPGNLAYQLCKTAESGTYKFLEVYKDAEALAHHGQTDYFKAAGPKFGAVLAGRPEIERLDGVD